MLRHLHTRAPLDLTEHDNGGMPPLAVHIGVRPSYAPYLRSHADVCGAGPSLIDGAWDEWGEPPASDTAPLALVVPARDEADARRIVACLRDTASYMPKGTAFMPMTTDPHPGDPDPEPFVVSLAAEHSEQYVPDWTLATA